MATRAQYTVDPATAAQFCRTWSLHVDALDRHLATDKWALVAITVVLIAYSIARIVRPAVLHGIVPDVVRSVLNLM